MVTGPDGAWGQTKCLVFTSCWWLRPRVQSTGAKCAVLCQVRCLLRQVCCLLCQVHCYMYKFFVCKFTESRCIHPQY